MPDMDYLDFVAKKEENLSLRVTEELGKRLKRYAKRRKVSKASVVRQAIESYLSEKEKQ